MKHVCPKKCTLFWSNKRMHLWDSLCIILLVYLNWHFEAFESTALRKFLNWKHFLKHFCVYKTKHNNTEIKK